MMNIINNFAHKITFLYTKKKILAPGFPNIESNIETE